MKELISKTVYEKTLEDKGVTINLDGHIPVRGYAVSLKGFEKIVDLKDFEYETIKVYILDNWYTLEQENTYIGTWINENKVYLDISVILSNIYEALKFGKANKQKAIYDLREKKEIKC